MGRPLGSRNKIRFRDHMGIKEIARLVELAKKKAETDTTILKFLLEQIFGKAVQPVGNDEQDVFRLQVIRPTAEVEKIVNDTIINDNNEEEKEEDGDQNNSSQFTNTE